MALDYSDWAASGDEDASFDKAPFDFDGARGKLLARITRTLKQLNNEKVAPQGGRDFEVLHNNGVHYRPTLNGHPLQLPGLPSEGVRIDRNKLQERLMAFAKDVEAKHFDDQLEAAMANAGTATSGSKASTGGQRAYTEEGRIRMRINGLRKGAVQRPDSEIKKLLVEDGVDAKLVDAALKPKKS